MEKFNLIKAIEHTVGSKQWMERPKMPSLFNAVSETVSCTTLRNYVKVRTEIRLGHTIRVPSDDIEQAQRDVTKFIIQYIFGDIKNALLELRYDVQSEMCSDQFNEQFDRILKEMSL